MGLFSRKIDQKVAAYQQELLQTHYAEVENMYRQMRGWRHDYRNHIQTMKAYAASGNYEAIRNYLDLLDTDLSTVDTVIKTGNPMTDAILNSKISLANSKSIRVTADAHIPVRLAISEIDLCCIIGNLFDTMLYKDLTEDGIDVSNGEAQKIAIARALYKDAPFIILDEPTAALDPIAEAEIYSKFNDIVGDRTAIYISHRLSSCRFCDEIVVFHNGTIIQNGSHESLLSDESGKYHQLWHAQAQYYDDKDK